MRKLWREHRKGCVFGAAAVVLLVCVYLLATFRVGIWWDDLFLYRQKDGTFSGKKDGVSYVLSVEPNGEDKTVRIVSNGETQTFRVTEDKNTGESSIYKNEDLLFCGVAAPMDRYYLLIPKDDGTDEGATGWSAAQSGAETVGVPDVNFVYKAAQLCTSFRGNTVFVLMAFVFAVIFASDCAFPRLAYTLHYARFSDGEPSAWYYTSQKCGRAVLLVAIIVCMALTFTTH